MYISRSARCRSRTAGTSQYARVTSTPDLGGWVSTLVHSLIEPDGLPVPPVLDLLESVLHRAGSPPSSSVVHSEPPSGTPSRRLPRGRKLCLKLDQPLKTAVGGRRRLAGRRHGEAERV